VKVLVTVAGGFLATALVRALRREGHEVRALVRPAAADALAVDAGGTRLFLEAYRARGAGLRRFVLAGSLAAAGPSAAGRREEEPLATA
jgi:nucleoside-diphosphate-sugar epimerase